MMYNLPVTGTGIVLGGVTLTSMNMLWLGLAIVTIGSILLTASKFFPRVAYEPTAVQGQTTFKWTLRGRALKSRLDAGSDVA